MAVPDLLLLHTSIIVFSHPESDIHISSNRNGLLLCLLLLGGSLSSHKHLWSDLITSTWSTRALGNLASHSIFATTRSRRTQVVLGGSLLLHHVKGNPLKPRSTKPQSSRTSRNAFICRSGLKYLPCISSNFIISLKSPRQHHGSWFCPSNLRINS